MPFEVSISGLDTGTEYTVHKPADDTMFGGAVESLMDSEVLERDLGRLEN